MAEKKEMGKPDEIFSKNIVNGRFGGKAKYRLVIDSPQAGVEKSYFQVLRALTDDEPFGRSLHDDKGHVIKTKDIYAAGETSSYWGSVEQRKGVQIDKFQQIMQNVGSMIKAMFQLLRELRILEERLKFYDDSNNGDKHSEVHLKSVWIDQVEGGAKNLSSVMGLSSQVGFAALADLFYTIHPKTSEKVDVEVQKLKESHGINKKVREVLGRKLKQYLVWKEKTYNELMVGQKFKLGYLRQHYSVIRLYLNWLRPYLRNVKRLQMRTEGVLQDKDLVAAFETSKVELEFLAIRDQYFMETERGKLESNFREAFPVTRVRVNFVAMPQMAYHDDNQRGAIHRGKTEILIDGAVLTKKQIDDYVKSLNEDDMDLLAAVDSSIEALREDLTYYLEKAGGAFDLQKKEEPPEAKTKITEGIFEPFNAIIDFFREIKGSSTKNPFFGGGNGLYDKEKKPAEKLATIDSYLAYYIFKKQNGLITE
ncbi:MAG: hypothetical protein Q8Q42_02975 [Nanoarchaeota archaeon]|nr:hypothetical protein [Nanoarchaeota archaeon]